MVDSHSLQSPNSKEKESSLCSEFNLESLSYTVADSFLDFDYIGNWIDENPAVVLGSEEAVPVMLDVKPDLRSTGFGDKDRHGDGLLGEEGKILGLSGPFSREKVEVVGIGKDGEMGCQSTSEKIEVEERVELRNSGCLAEDQTKKVCLDGEMNDLVSAFNGMNGLKQDGDGEKTGGEMICGSDAVKIVEVTCASDDCTETCVFVGCGGEEAGIKEKMILDDNGQKGGESARTGDRGDASESESEAESSSSSSSESSDSDSDSESESESSSDDDGDEKDQKVKEKNDDMETEEGEIVASETEEMVAWSDDEDDGTGVTSTGPLRSKNELTELPPVPSVSVTLQPHHQILPIGTVLSILGAQVIVEGVEKHNPLNEDSILWITKSGSPLGLVDEIFGPVKNPYYIVRYNSESEIPAEVKPGISVSFVQEFAVHVLHNKSLYQKGYDASGANDEEISDEEFSDDEKEAEYKKMLKNKKRGKNDEKAGNQGKEEKKFGNCFRNRKHNPRNNKEPTTKQPVDSSRHHMPPPNFSLNQGNQSLPARLPGQGFASPASSGFSTFPGGVNGIPIQQPQNVGLPQMPTNAMQMMPQMFAQPFFQMPPGNGFPFQRQINATPQLPSNLVLPGCQPGFGGGAGQPGFGAGAGFLPWPTCVGQNTFMTASPFGMVGCPVQQASFPFNAEQQSSTPPAIPPIQQASALTNAGREASSSSVPGEGYKHDSQQQPALSSNPGTRQSFKHVRHNGGGRKQWRRGGGQFRGGRGGQNSG